jgi:hypothetical protein
MLSSEQRKKGKKWANEKEKKERLKVVTEEFYWQEDKKAREDEEAQRFFLRTEEGKWELARAELEKTRKRTQELPRSVFSSKRGMALRKRGDGEYLSI